jgi:type II secretory pathway component PulF
MTPFQYQAVDQQGQPVSGTCEALDAAAAKLALEEGGLREVEVRPLAARTEALERLSQSEALAVTRQLADLSRAGIPLCEGLRAAADELKPGRLARVFRKMAAETEAGKPLDDVLGDSAARFPPHIVGLLRAARRTGRLEQALTHLLDQHFRMRELSRKLRTALAYPLFILGAAVAMFLMLQLFELGQLRSVVDELELNDQTPFLTQLLIWWTEEGWIVASVLLVVFVVTLALVRIVVGAAVWRRLLATIPLLGPIWHWAGVAQWTRMLAMLLDQQLPLHEALRLAADGSFDANVGQAARQLAVGAEQGRSLSEMLSKTYRLPNSLVPLVRWGEQSGAMSDAMHAASDMFEGRLALRSNLLRLILPPLVLLLIGLGVSLVIVALLAPMLELIRMMSSFM